MFYFRGRCCFCVHCPLYEFVCMSCMRLGWAWMQICRRGMLDDVGTPMRQRHPDPLDTAVRGFVGAEPDHYHLEAPLDAFSSCVGRDSKDKGEASIAILQSSNSDQVYNSVPRRHSLESTSSSTSSSSISHPIRTIHPSNRQPKLIRFNHGQRSSS